MARDEFSDRFWLVVSQNPQGPFVMQSLPMYAVIPGKGSQRVRRFRTYFNKGSNPKVPGSIPGGRILQVLISQLLPTQYLPMLLRRRPAGLANYR